MGRQVGSGIVARPHAPAEHVKETYKESCRALCPMASGLNARKGESKIAAGVPAWLEFGSAAVAIAEWWWRCRRPETGCLALRVGNACAWRLHQRGRHTGDGILNWIYFRNIVPKVHRIHCKFQQRVAQDVTLPPGTGPNGPKTRPDRYCGSRGLMD